MAYKLSYISVNSRSEPIRFLLKYGGIEFEDDRISREVWPTIKTEMPFGQLPVLEYKGTKYHQSLAICRYFGKQIKLTGKDDWEDLEIDAAADTTNDLIIKIIGGGSNTPEAFKEKLGKEDVIYFLTKIDEQIKKNKGYLALGRLTWADLVFVSYMYILITLTSSDIFNNYSNIEELVKKVKEIPRIKEYLANRPKD